MSVLTKPQLSALDAAFTKEGAMFANVNRTGGAYRRLCLRLASLGLLTEKAPFKITLKGLYALRDHRAAKWAKRGCMAYLADLKDVEAAINAFESADFLTAAASPYLDPVTGEDVQTLDAETFNPFTGTPLAPAWKHAEFGTVVTVRKSGITFFLVDASGQTVDEFIPTNGNPDSYLKEQGFSLIS